MKEIRYTYKPDITVFLLRTILFSIFSLVSGYMARINDSGLLITPIIDISVKDVSILYLCLAIASAIFVIFSFLGLIKALTKGLLNDLCSTNEIVLSTLSITLPKNGKSRETITLKYAEIFDLNILEVNKQEFFNIYCADEMLTISQNMLPNSKSFDELVNFISRKVTSLPIRHYKNGSEYAMYFTL